MKKPPYIVLFLENKGRGLIATRSIKCGEEIIENHALLIENKQNNSEVIRRHVMNYDDYRDLIMLGESTLINHSDNENAEAYVYMSNTMPKIVIRATKNIKKGEEICINYGPDYPKKWLK